MLLPDDVALVFHRNMPVIAARLLKYFEAEEFRGGGTGSQPRLGFAAALLAVSLLAASGFIACAAANLPVPHKQPQTWRVAPSRPQRSQWQFEPDQPASLRNRPDPTIYEVLPPPLELEGFDP